MTVKLTKRQKTELEKSIDIILRHVQLHKVGKLAGIDQHIDTLKAFNISLAHDKCSAA